MTPEEALALVMQEGLGADGLVAVVWRGEDPGPDRVWRARDALRVVFTHLEGRDTLDRELCVALYRLAGLHADVYLRALEQGPVRRELLENELPALSLAAESVFNDAWEQ